MKERLENLTEEVPLLERFPDLFIYLNGRWKAEFGTIRRIITERRMPFDPDQEYQNFATNWSVLGLVMEKGGEWLRANRPEVYRKFKDKFFSENDRGEVILNKEVQPEDFALALEKKLFRGLKVLCIGGIEGRVLADFGAETVNVDPFVEKAPQKIKRENLIEVPACFSSETAQKLMVERGPFDISFSCSLFDRGSGLDPIFRLDISPVKSSEINNYGSVLRDILLITKKGGFSIHNGNMLKLAAGNSGDCRAYKVWPNTIDEGNTSWVIGV